jgi:hypothetical protein
MSAQGNRPSARAGETYHCAMLSLAALLAQTPGGGSVCIMQVISLISLTGGGLSRDGVLLCWPNRPFCWWKYVVCTSPL